MYKNILVPVDGSELSLAALKEAVAFARSIKAKLHLLHVVHHFYVNVEGGWASQVLHKLEEDHEQESRQAAEAMVSKLVESAKKDSIEVDGLVVIHDSPYEQIIAQASKLGCDLIMMASHGRKGLDSLLLGSETAKVLTHSKLPVLVVR
jgi:nucleotide-binding universal stress UspA family protein